MDNDDKIKNSDSPPEQGPDSKAIFLKDDAVRYAGVESYDLEKEFAKTKKNKSVLVVIGIMLFVAVFTAAAIFVTLYIQNRSKDVPVDITEFADVNLKDVLDKAKQYENRLQKAQRELADLQNEMNRQINDVEQQASQDIDLIKAKNLTAAEEDRQIAAATADRDKNINAIRSEYEPKIAAKEAEIAEVQEKIAEYDTQMVERAKKQEEILNNQQKRFELEMEETVSYYEERIAELEKQRKEEVAQLKEYQDRYNQQLRENHAAEIAKLKREQAEEIRKLILKYNPFFTEENLRAVLANAVGEIPAPRLGTYREVLSSEGIISKEDFDTLHSQVYTVNMLLDRLNEIPYINSVPTALTKLQAYGNSTYTDYENVIQDLVDVIEYKNVVIYRRNTELGHFQHALNTLVENSREHGYILDPRNLNAIQVYIDETYNIETGDTGYVFRRDDQMIAKIIFTVGGGGTTAALTEQVSEDKTMEPFDKILIEIE